MKIEELLHHLEPGSRITVSNKPYAYTGKAKITLAGGDVRYWLANSSGGMLAIAPDDEEIVVFESVDEEVEPEDGLVLYRGKEHEFSYEDSGAVTEVVGETEFEEDDRYAFSDYESDDGAVVRLVTNENTGDQYAFYGRIVVEEDILPVA